MAFEPFGAGWFASSRSRDLTSSGLRLESRVRTPLPLTRHPLVEYSRDRADGSIMTLHRNLWVVTSENGRWGIKQRSY
ncbi:hypothetical protein ACVILL_003053 [Bradyrhizobium sp. USDA 3364]